LRQERAEIVHADSVLVEAGLSDVLSAQGLVVPKEGGMGFFVATKNPTNNGIAAAAFGIDDFNFNFALVLAVHDKGFNLTRAAQQTGFSSQAQTNGAQDCGLMETKQRSMP
jgi:hypothetical protein